MKSVLAPHLRSAVKFGRRHPTPGLKKLCLKDYIQPDLPAPPPSCDFSAGGQPGLGNIFLNGQLGDCVIAAGYHVVAMQTGNAGSLFVATDAEITLDYMNIGGYKPGDPSTDNGCDEETALNYWRTNGFADGTKIAQFLQLDASNPTEVRQAMALFENLFFGVDLPDVWVNPFPQASGFTWDNAPPDANNGHAFIGVGYNDQGVQIDTWGLIGTLTWAAVQGLCSGSGGGQLFTLLTPDQISKATAKTPSGLAWDQLTADFAALEPRGGMTAS